MPGATQHECGATAYQLNITSKIKIVPTTSDECKCSFLRVRRDNHCPVSCQLSQGAGEDPVVERPGAHAHRCW